jgi:hypothetical protein
MDMMFYFVRAGKLYSYWNSENSWSFISKSLIRVWFFIFRYSLNCRDCSLNPTMQIKNFPLRSRVFKVCRLFSFYISFVVLKYMMEGILWRKTLMEAVSSHSKYQLPASNWIHVYIWSTFHLWSYLRVACFLTAKRARLLES